MSDSGVVSQPNTTQGPEYATSTDAAELLQRGASQEYLRALHRAKKAAAGGKDELAVGWCHYAATVAWTVNPGFFYCLEIEQLLGEIGQRHLGSASASSPSPWPPRRFLHVTSTAYETGGHTRAISRWIEICAEHAPLEQHSILISIQGDEPVPSWLGISARRTGGEIIQLPSRTSWLQAAAEMRAQVLEFDAVILHLHPNDPLPNMALYDHARPALFFRISDHVFNLGLDAATVLADIRPIGRAMSARFCCPDRRGVMLPLPLLDEGPVLKDKGAARKKLGLPADGLIALTIGDVAKFIPVPGYSFSTVVRSLCAENARLRVIAVGLSEAEPFPGLGQSVEGRFIPVGVVREPETLDLYYRAADIYLDACPVNSFTAVLDAARYGLPVQTLNIPDRCLMWCNDPAIDSVLSGASSQDEYVARVLEWLEWPEKKRLELGARFRAAVLRDHCGASWKNNWLDPAIGALDPPLETAARLQPEFTKEDELCFQGLGEANPEDDRLAGMFVARSVLATVPAPFPIRISAVARSIKPLLAGTASKGNLWARILLFALLIATFLPKPIYAPLRMIWRVSFKKSRKGVRP